MRLAEREVDAIARFLRLGVPEFLAAHTRLTADRRSLSLNEKADGACAFLAGDDCLIHDAKPQQCRDFPARWNFPGFEALCQATKN